MSAGPMQGLMRNDLRVVTIFMVIMVLLISGLELNPRYIPSPTTQAQPPGNNQHQNQTQNLTTGEVLSRSGYTNEGQSSEEDFGLGFQLVTMVKVELMWTDDYGSNDDFSIELKREGQSLDKAQGSTGDLTVQVTAKTGDNLAGNFTAVITCVSAPGLIGPLPVDRDNGNAWDLKATATYAEGSP